MKLLFLKTSRTEEIVTNQNRLQQADVTRRDPDLEKLHTSRKKERPVLCGWSVTLIGIQYFWIACNYFLLKS